MLRQNCSLDDEMASESPPPPTTFWFQIWGDVYDNLCNFPKTDHQLITPASCRDRPGWQRCESKRGLNFSVKFFHLLSTFRIYGRVQHYEWLPENVRYVCYLRILTISRVPPLHDDRFFTLPSSVANHKNNIGQHVTWTSSFFLA